MLRLRMPSLFPPQRAACTRRVLWSSNVAETTAGVIPFPGWSRSAILIADNGEIEVPAEASPPYATSRLATVLNNKNPNKGMSRASLLRVRMFITEVERRALPPRATPFNLDSLGLHPNVLLQITLLGHSG
ncbi:hypothetical protein PM082_005858 [Marasmius tenuissimus]|nr:hypothetical protein PM082_005858 [Marasmius tenuissimus]